MAPALFARNTSLLIPLATILTCVPLRGTPSFTPVWQSFSSIVSLMYPSPICSILVPIHRCVKLLVRTVPVPLSLSVVAPVVDTPVSPRPGGALVLATPFPPNPLVGSLVGATPRTPTPVLNI